ncbi:hypothetical protein [Sphaerisporangium dianthi]|uniref:MarR family transcriptional regulator n=1 Tax=Sphaerisporangium dianthi TaxID=1436120 RepID=A0ABV9C7Y1_9ACTN
MTPLRLSPPQWRVLRHLATYSATAMRTGFLAKRVRDTTGADDADLTGLADLGHITGRLHGGDGPPLAITLRSHRGDPRLRIHLTPTGKSAAQAIEIAHRALRHLRAHAPAPLTLTELQHDAGVGDDTLTELEACGFIDIAPMCPECEEPAERATPTSWTPAWGRAPSWSHLDGEPLCPVVGANGYQPATPTSTDRRITLTSIGRRYAEPHTSQDRS